MPSGTQRELSEELAGSALKSMDMLRCSKEVARRRSDRMGTRSCVHKRELTDPNIRSECVDGSREETKKKRKSEEEEQIMHSPAGA